VDHPSKQQFKKYAPCCLLVVSPFIVWVGWEYLLILKLWIAHCPSPGWEMRMGRGNRSTWRKSATVLTLSRKNPTWTDLELNRSHGCEKRVTKLPELWAVLVSWLCSYLIALSPFVLRDHVVSRTWVLTFWRYLRHCFSVFVSSEMSFFKPMILICYEIRHSLTLYRPEEHYLPGYNTV
jgi:hypothetical protein